MMYKSRNFKKINVLFFRTASSDKRKKKKDESDGWVCKEIVLQALLSVLELFHSKTNGNKSSWSSHIDQKCLLTLLYLYGVTGAHMHKDIWTTAYSLCIRFIAAASPQAKWPFPMFEDPITTYMNTLTMSGEIQLPRLLSIIILGKLEMITAH